jgi:hypothetical protein
VHVGHHHGEEGPVDAAPALEDLREERALAELGNLQLDVPGLGGQPRAVPVAVVLALLSPPVWTGSDHRGRLRLDEDLQDDLDAADEVDVAAGTERVE